MSRKDCARTAPKPKVAAETPERNGNVLIHVKDARPTRFTQRTIAACERSSWCIPAGRRDGSIVYDKMPWKALVVWFQLVSVPVSNSPFEIDPLINEACNEAVPVKLVIVKP